MDLDKMNNNKQILCSNCFSDFGLRFDAEKIGIAEDTECNHCKSTCGKKLNKELLEELAHTFFVRGSVAKFKYGASPRIEFNNLRDENDNFSVGYSIDRDIKLIEESLNIKFFHYGPRLWLLGEIEPLKELQNKRKRQNIIDKIIETYPVYLTEDKDNLFRLRKNPKSPSDVYEYDSPPSSNSYKSRLGTPSYPIMYTSPDIECCIHECRATLEDELYIAKLSPNNGLKLINLSHIPVEDCTEFESLDISLQMLFSAGKHAYKITQDIAAAINRFGYDGIIYPSYFTYFRTGQYPFETIYGISLRRIPEYRDLIMRNTVQNVCIFGRPIRDSLVTVTSINRILLRAATYDYHFGPIVS